MRLALATLVASAALFATGCAAAPVARQVNSGPSATASAGIGTNIVQIAAAGDVACPNATSSPGCRAPDTAKLIKSLKPKLVLALGDLAYESGSVSDFNAGYAKSWGAFKVSTFPVPGNHEYRTDGAAGYRQWWGSGVTPGGHTWHSQRVGLWLVLGLDSDCAEVGGCDPASPQGQWLAAHLVNAPKCVLAIWHHPRRSSGLHGDNSAVQPLWQQLAAAGADVVLNGHDHDYERFAPMDSDAKPASTGMREFVVGTGGKQPYPIVRKSAGSETSVQGIPGVLSLNLGSAGWSWRFITTDGAVRDSGSSNCTG